VLLFVAGFLLMVGAQAQNTGTVVGTVRDTTGALIPGATVILVSEQDKASKRDTKSNGQGDFTIPAVPPQTYDLIVTMTGFEAYRVNGIQVHPGDHLTIDKVALKIGQVTEEMTVSANTAGVSLDSPEKSALITADDIKRLSTIGRDASELIKFLPGFAVSTGGGLGNLSVGNSTSQTMGFTSSSVSSFSANGATPQTGATSVLSDGSSVIDPGDMGASISNVNMDMVQEIKVSTSNFGADSAKGPVVINAVGKSGGSSYHGTAYLFARNGALNANDWYSNYENAPRPPSSYYFPGANVGGPIKIPGTDFNHNKKLTFFTALEVYRQTAFQQLLESFVPTNTPCPTNVTSFDPTAAGTALGSPGMLSGNLSASCIAQNLGISTATLQSYCPNDYTTNGGVTGGATISTASGFCYPAGGSYVGAPTTGGAYDKQDCLIYNAQQYSNPTNNGGAAGGSCNPGAFLPVDPRTAAYIKFYPKPNRLPRAEPQSNLITDGYNYQTNLLATHNGFQYRGRVDDNLSDSTKLYVTYNFETINDENPLTNNYYAGSDLIPFPTPSYSHTKSNSLSLNFTKVFTPTLTNELIGAATYFYEPAQFANPAILQDGSTGWSGGRFYKNGVTQLPGIVDYEEGVPDFAANYDPPTSQFFRKFSYDAADNLSKTIRTHSIKVGVYVEVTANNQTGYNYTQGDYAFNHYGNSCLPENGDTHPENPTGNAALENNIANFLQLCATGFTQTNTAINADLHFRTFDGYFTDEWRATKKLTLTYGIRLDHLGPWFSPDGIGMAVWNPPAKYAGVVNIPPVGATLANYPGISSHKTNPSVPISGQQSRALFYSPRVGIAYDLYGNGKTTFRGGWGAYRFHDSYNDSAGALNTALGYQTYNPTTSCTVDQISGSGAIAQGGAVPANPGAYCGLANAPFSIYALDQHDNAQPVTYNYNFTVDQVMPGHSNLEVSYVGNQSHDLFTEGNLSNQNYIPLGAYFQPDPISQQIHNPSDYRFGTYVQDYRPYPNYIAVYVPHHIAYQNYNGLQASFNKQTGAFIYGVNYTWEKALGIRGDYRTGAAIADPSTLRNNYGYLGFNRNNILNATYSWQVGNLYHGNRFLADVINQWEFSGITGLQSGPDIAVLNGSSSFNLSGGISYQLPGAGAATQSTINSSTYLGTPDISLQPVITCDPRKNLQSNNPLYGKQYFNGACFALPKFGSNGEFELPDLHGPAYFNTDLTVQRTFPIHEKQNVQFRLAGFNFLNHPLRSFAGGNNVGLGLGFGDPLGFVAATPAQAFAGAVQDTPNFGYTPYKQGYRIVELGARYNF
jgi:hypothetical protein